MEKVKNAGQFQVTGEYFEFPPIAESYEGGGLPDNSGNLSLGGGLHIPGERFDGQALGYGCGSAQFDLLVPDRIGDIDLLPACIAHDQCYDNASTVPRAVCDAEFGDQVYAACRDAGHGAMMCFGLSMLYQYSVEWFGASAYHP